MSTTPLIKPELGKQSKGGREPLFSMQSLFFKSRKGRWLWKFERACLRSDYLRFCLMHHDHLDLSKIGHYVLNILMGLKLPQDLDSRIETRAALIAQMKISCKHLQVWKTILLRKSGRMV